LVNSLVDDIISPPLGIALGQASLDNLFIVIKSGKHGQSKYPTLEQGSSIISPKLALFRP
jgi:large conductance mechanosensitive channel